MSQQGQLVKLGTCDQDGNQLWAYRYRIAGRGSRRLQRGGFASEHDAREALARAVETTRRRRRSSALSLTVSELVEVYLAQHEVEPVTTEKLRWLLSSGTERDGESVRSRELTTRSGLGVAPRRVSWRVLDRELAGTYRCPVPTAVSPDDPTYAGQAVYTARFLRFYDLVVLRFNGHLAWRCGPERLVRMYDEHVSARHLDIGVGSGYFLDKCRYPVQSPEITLMDLNPNSLEAAADRIRRYRPKTHQANALEPFGLPPGTFDSVGLNWLLHCIPGDMTSKGAVFDHCKAVLAPGGVVFGSTVLTGGVPQTWFSRWMLDQLNDRNETFANRDDDLDTLAAQLDQRFHDTQLEVVGSVAMFSGRT